MKNQHLFTVKIAVPIICPDPNSALRAERSINFFIDHQCPQCGAPAQLRETDRFFRCDYCRVSSYLLENRFFRYALPNNASADKDLIYFPYWRFKGMLFSCMPSGIQDRFLDMSRQAVPSPFFPASVGLRSQAMKLRFVSADMSGWFIKPALPSGQALNMFLNRINQTLREPLLHQAHIGESLSLLYAPFYLNRRLVDAVLNNPVTTTANELPDISKWPGGPAADHIRFLSTLCPNCGWDMQGSRDALVLYCGNCSSMWKASEEGMSRVNVAHLPAGSNKDFVYLPFWRIRADVDGTVLNTYADLIRAANLPKINQPQWNRRRFYFWGPAFKLRPHSFLRLTHQMTVSQPLDDLVAEVPNGPVHPVNLPVSESLETLKLNLAGIMRPKKMVETSLRQVHITPKRYLLVFLPFEKRHHDLVQPTFNISVNRNQLALSTNL